MSFTISQGRDARDRHAVRSFLRIPMKRLSPIAKILSYRPSPVYLVRFIGSGGRMEQKPFRHRHDGWTPARQIAFLEALKTSGCVSDACRHVGLSTTSARRAYKRMPDFARSWDLMLSYAEPLLVRAAFERAVTGWDEPVFHNGKLVGHRRRWSDSLLRTLLQREQRAGETAAREIEHDGGRGASTVPIMPIEEVEAILMRRLAAVERRLAREKAMKEAAGDGMGRESRPGG